MCCQHWTILCLIFVCGMFWINVHPIWMRGGIRNLTLKNPLETKCFPKTNVVQLAGAGDAEIGFLCFTETFCGRAGWNYYCWSWIIAMASGESGKAARDNKENIVLKISARAEWCFYFYLSFIKSVMDLNRDKSPQNFGVRKSKLVTFVAMLLQIYTFL